MKWNETKTKQLMLLILLNSKWNIRKSNYIPILSDSISKCFLSFFLWWTQFLKQMTNNSVQKLIFFPNFNKNLWETEAQFDNKSNRFIFGTEFCSDSKWFDTQMSESVQNCPDELWMVKSVLRLKLIVRCDCCFFFVLLNFIDIIHYH